ncbi:MAG TPA: response regulator transcription factor [Spirochaetota bacterium]|nr:response regulator transcription factor [Spirochaetota bacterium]HOD14224.1 response regulator transcription factor [Spirochaetota bacterium]HPG52414.1 response regulator transcription factor [Spirochaetota bacterium]HPN11400.1 response regulator transcription factor [Spirochaetota bacterium]HQL81178.1 response regulator transcription factor [Spirochaetota bacterium]
MNEGPVILIIDDEPQIRRLLRLTLDAHGYQVHDATTAREGLQQVAMVRPDLVILDLGLPDMSGLEALRELREWSQTPVIVLTVKNSEQDKVDLLDAGANDYVTKPFGMGELLARMRAALRLSLPDSSDGVFSTGGITIDFARRIVTRNGEELRLTPTEYALLRFLARHAGKVVTHAQIIHELWGPDSQPDTSYLRVYVLQLRRKIEQDPASPRLLITEPGVGYRLTSDE